MIGMLNASRHFGHGPTAKIVLDRADLRVEPRDRVGILAASGTGKTTIARLLSGMDRPNSGVVIREARLSYPLGFSAGLHPTLSAAENVRLAAAMTNCDPIDLHIRVETFAELGAAFYKPVAELAPGQRGQLAMGLSLCSDHDVYLADELSAVGDAEYQDKVEAAINGLMEHAGLILLTRHIRTIERYATRFIVLAGARLIECEDGQQAREILELDQMKKEDLHALV